MVSWANFGGLQYLQYLFFLAGDEHLVADSSPAAPGCPQHWSSHYTIHQSIGQPLETSRWSTDEELVMESRRFDSIGNLKGCNCRPTTATDSTVARSVR